MSRKPRRLLPITLAAVLAFPLVAIQGINAMPASAAEQDSFISWAVEREITLDNNFATGVGETSASFKTLVKVDNPALVTAPGLLQLRLELHDADGLVTQMDSETKHEFASSSRALADQTPSRQSSDGLNIEISAAPAGGEDVYIWFGNKTSYILEPQKNYQLKINVSHDDKSGTVTPLAVTEVDSKIVAFSNGPNYTATSGDENITIEASTCVPSSEAIDGTTLTATLTEDDTTVSSQTGKFTSADGFAQATANTFVYTPSTVDEAVVYKLSTELTGFASADVIDPVLVINNGSSDVQEPCFTGLDGQVAEVTSDGGITFDQAQLENISWDDSWEVSGGEVNLGIAVIEDSSGMLVGTSSGRLNVTDNIVSLDEASVYGPGDYRAQLFVELEPVGPNARLIGGTDLSGALNVASLPSKSSEITTSGEGTGQGGISTTDYTWQNYPSPTESSADGSGGLLTLGNLDYSNQTIELRRVAQDGPDLSFGGTSDGVVSVSYPDDFRATDFFLSDVAYYGTDRDNFVVSIQRINNQPLNSDLWPSNYGNTTLYSYGSYAAGQQGTGHLDMTALEAHCLNENPDATAYDLADSSPYLLSSPTAQPQLQLDCTYKPSGGSFPFQSLFFIADLDPANGTLSNLKQRSSMPDAVAFNHCVKQSMSELNAAATGNEPLSAALLVQGSDFCGNVTGASATSELRIVEGDGDVTTMSNPIDFTGLTGLDKIVHGGFKTVIADSRIFALIKVGDFSSSEIYLGELDTSTQVNFADFVKLNVNGDTAVGSTTLSAIPNFAETVTDTILLQRRDSQFDPDTQTVAEILSATRVDLVSGEMTTYQQAATSFPSMAGPQRGSYRLLTGSTDGKLNMWVQTDESTLTKVNWVTTGEFDQGVIDSPLNQDPAAEPVLGGQSPQTSNDNGGTSGGSFTAPTPFAGPVLTGEQPATGAAGQELSITGNNLDTVTKVLVGETEIDFSFEQGLLRLSLPSDLEAGEYEVVLVSSGGNLTAIDKLSVSSGPSLDLTTPRPSTKRYSDTAKIYYYGAVGAGKVQFFYNGQEIAWVNALDSTDKKLAEGAYLVRTVDLVENQKNVIEIFVDGERVRRTAYSN